MSMDAIGSISDFPSIAYTEARSCSLKRKPFLYCDLTRRLRMNGCGRDEVVIECARGKRCTEILRGWSTGRCPSSGVELFRPKNRRNQPRRQQHQILDQTSDDRHGREQSERGYRFEIREEEECERGGQRHVRVNDRAS